MYNKLRNEVQREIKEAKSDYLRSCFESNMGKPKKLWQHLKTLGYNNKSKASNNIVLRIGNKLCYDALEICNYINSFFTTIASNLVANFPASPGLFGTNSMLFKNHYLSKGIAPGNFNLKPVSTDYVYRELCNINPQKSTGLDQIFPRFLKDGAKQLAPILQHIINLSISKCTVPKDQKHAKVTPLFNKNDKLEVSNYRPISVLNSVSKLLEKCVYDQVQSYLSKHNVIYGYQSGFRPGFSTETCLIYLTDFIKENVSKGLYVGTLLLDVQKAFDSVNHDILCEKIKAIGIDPSWFKSYLSERLQTVTLNGVQSTPMEITCGVPQGSLLGPLLYLIYSNDMEIAVKRKLLLYADDSIILVCHKDPKVISKYLSEELHSVNNWLIDNKLSLHVGKTECILFGSKRKLNRVNDFQVTYRGHIIKGSNSVKYLGVILDQDLSGISMVSKIIPKAIGKLKFLYRYGDCLNTELRRKLCNALIQCHLDYCCTSWYSSLSQKMKQKLQITQNKVVRYILKFGPRSHIGQSELDTLKYLRIQDRVSQQRLNIVYKIKNGTSPQYLCQNFRQINEVHGRNTRSNAKRNYFVQHVNSVNKTSFHFSAIQDWNYLPLQIKEQKTYAGFKSNVKRFLADRSLKHEENAFTNA